MKKFILKSNYIVSINGDIQLKLSPDDIVIQDLLASNHQLDSKVEINTQIDSLILEMTPILFERFQDMEGVSQILKDQYEL
jgi:hypothetical protein